MKFEFTPVKDIIKDSSYFKDVKYVIHLASMTNAEKSFGKEKEMYRNNIDCLANVIEYCKKNNAKLSNKIFN